MTVDDPSEEEQHADGIVEIQEYRAPPPPTAKEFAPWHKPRKQYVREYQWSREILDLVNRWPRGNSTLKYLGLPGVDLLDLRYFHKAICETKNLGLRFLGFNASAQPRSPANSEMNLALDEVRRLRGVDPLSNVLGDGFERMANCNSMAWHAARDLGPYDVVNLDFCDGFGSHAPGDLHKSNYDAVAALLAIQARTIEPWLLFLTTRVDKPNVRDDVLEILVEKYRSNLGEYGEFRSASQDCFGIDSEEALRDAKDSASGLLSVFLTGLCKWFVAQGLTHQPPVSVEVCSAFGYRVQEGVAEQDLVSLALRFRPTLNPVGDPLGLASGPSTGPDEGSLATRAISRVANRTDADNSLVGDQTLRHRMTVATSELLGVARYDVNEYFRWVEEARSE